MRVFPFKDPAGGVMPTAAQFIMNYPCIVGYIIPRKDSPSSNRTMWYIWGNGEIHRTASKNLATPVTTKEQLDTLLQCIALLGGASSVFVEPHKP